MKDTRIIMGMPITVEISGKAQKKDLTPVFDYFRQVDDRYSTYKPESEVSQYNGGKKLNKLSGELQYVLQLCEAAKSQSGGYFDIKTSDGSIDPSGLVKGWSIANAANLLRLNGWDNFYIEAGGDVQAAGVNDQGEPWKLGIRNPFNLNEVVKVLQISDCGIATSGNYIRGAHIYNPKNAYKAPEGIASLTVVGPNIYEADLLATTAFAMGMPGISYVEGVAGYEAYMIDVDGIATYTGGFNEYVA